MVFRSLIISIVSLFLSIAVFSHDHGSHDHGSHDIHIMKPWARASAPGAPSAGFMQIVNNGKMDDVLLSISGDFAKKLEVHESKMADGVMKMQHLHDGITIPAGQQVVLKPGSYHLMFMGLNKNFELGETYMVELTFKHAGKVMVKLPVQEAPMTDMEHTH